MSRKERNKTISDTLGASAPPILSVASKKVTRMDHPEIQRIKAEVVSRLSGCSTNIEALELEIASLMECIGIATELYQKDPIPDNAYQLSSLVNAHKAALSQLERMKDPKAMLDEIEQQIKGMFMAVVKALAVEIDKTKRELSSIHPEDKHTVEDHFNRMMNAVQPETQNIYDDLNLVLRKILGIKGKK